MKIKKRTVTIVETHSVTISGAATAAARAKDAASHFIDAEPVRVSANEQLYADTNARREESLSPMKLSEKLRRLVEPFRRNKQS